MELNKIIDHTILKANASSEDVIRCCTEAREHGFFSVCVNSRFAKLVHEQLEGSGVKTCCVVGFPLGAMSSASKAFETKTAVSDGADEIDMVIAVGALKEGDYEYVLNDIKAVVGAAGDAAVKVIIETCLLSDEEKVKACKLSVEGGAKYVKTSTGFGNGGADARDIALMRKTVGANIGVKASGGIRTKQDALKMVEAGASRIGASASIKICE